LRIGGANDVLQSTVDQAVDGGIWRRRRCRPATRSGIASGELLGIDFGLRGWLIEESGQGRSGSRAEGPTALGGGEEEGVVGVDVWVVVGRGIGIGESAEATEQATDAMGDLEVRRAMSAGEGRGACWNSGP
jgi:hypothetical protein